MTSRLEIAIGLINEASEELKQIQGEVEDVDQATTDLGDSNVGTQVSFTELNSAIGIARQGLQLAQQVYGETIQKTLDYGDQVRNLGRTIGATAEESSRLIQAADDVGISADSLSSAMEAAIRKGVSPTIEGMGKLADEYNRIQDPITRSKFLMDNFGRSGSDLAALMEKGSKGIRELGEQADATGQVLNGPALEAQRNLEIGIDNLQDSVEGLTYTFSGEAIPAANDFIDALNRTVDKVRELPPPILDTALATDQAYLKNNLLIQSYEQLMVGLNAFAPKAQESNDRMRDSIPNTVAFAEANDRAADRVGGLITSEDRLAAATTQAKNAKDADTLAAQQMAEATNAATAASEALKASQDGWLGSTASQAEAALTASGASADQYAAGLRAIDDALGSNLTVTADQQADVDALTQKYVSGKISIDAYNSGLDDIEAVYMPRAAGALDLGNEAMIEFSTTIKGVNTRLGVDTPAAFLTGSGAATTFGVQLKKESDPGSGMYIFGVGVQSLTANVNALSAAIRNVPELALPNSGPTGGAPLTGKGPGGADGLDMIVPPGYPNDSYNVRAQSGERVLITKPGQSSGGGDTHYYSFQIANVNASSPAEFFDMLQREAEQRGGG